MHAEKFHSILLMEAWEWTKKIEEEIQPLLLAKGQEGKAVSFSTRLEGVKFLLTWVESETSATADW